MHWSSAQSCPFLRTRLIPNKGPSQKAHHSTTRVHYYFIAIGTPVPKSEDDGQRVFEILPLKLHSLSLLLPPLRFATSAFPTSHQELLFLSLSCILLAVRTRSEYKNVETSGSWQIEERGLKPVPGNGGKKRRKRKKNRIGRWKKGGGGSWESGRVP